MISFQKGKYVYKIIKKLPIYLIANSKRHIRKLVYAYIYDGHSSIE
jgi:hypothetical protein